ncbi:ComEC/Rec2 family competence protein [Marinomonas hwangdonensis]|uniref:ComEC/Rec2 family competence protein n=1 Tax=Marinomonas hwangdonensis TaxID=1053647 RepID=A0A3M8Q4J3_9GAMM|nr:ComEC/Rec2 family competence protein [Marinomonas hwangdonensis]RNF50054.1 ComEC/Rec2 family competence protein [Marinomonas hwangdonensis]
MLLSSLSILIGAVMVPIGYEWLYSTHIILVCLYLIHSKRLILCLAAGFSIFAVAQSEYFSLPTFEFQLDERVLIDFDEKKIHVERPFNVNSLSVDDNASIQIVYFHENGTRFIERDFTLKVVSQLTSLVTDDFSLQVDPASLAQARIRRITLPNKNGAWWERNLYVKRQMAELSLTRLDKEQWAVQDRQQGFRDRIQSHLDDKLQGFDSWRFSKALLLGQDNLWSEKDTWVVRVLGLAHLFVVSGLHTGFMFIIGRLFSQFAWRIFPDKWLLSGLTRWHCDAIIVMPLLFTYAYLTDWGEPVVRASIMLSVYMLARLLALKFSAYEVITFALWLVLLLDPRTVLSPGLWLSFSMVYLLIGFCQGITVFSRLFMVQVMLTTASMVLVLGWQDAISGVSILVNVMLIPFAGLVWFPWGILSSLEAALVGTSYGYFLLDKLLGYVMYSLEWIAFKGPLLNFDSFSSTFPRWIMLLLVVLWVYQSPLKRGMVMALGIWCVLFSTSLFKPFFHYSSITNIENVFVFQENNRVITSDRWLQKDIMVKPLSIYLGANKMSQSHATLNFLSTQMLRNPDPFLLLEKEVRWVLLKQANRQQTLTTFDALDIHWVIVPPGESLHFYLHKDYVSLRHSSCIYLFFLVKSDTCKRVETLESMLNYQQI